MNYLAHLLLSRQTPESLIGNLMGDFLKGVDRSTLPTAIEMGIRNHIAIDAFTDTHPLVKELKPLFSAKYRRFAPIILDITFDYLLSQNWDKYCKSSRLQYIQSTEEILLSHRHLMPPRMFQVVETLVDHQVFSHYNSLEGLATALDRTASRLRTFYGAINELEPLLPEIEVVFIPFMHELQEFVAQKNIEA